MKHHQRRHLPLLVRLRHVSKLRLSPLWLFLSVLLATFLLIRVSERVSAAAGVWFIIVAMAAAGLGIGFDTWRQYHKVLRMERRLRSLCIHCGYDLRATPDRCPECGRVPNPDSADIIDTDDRESR